MTPRPGILRRGFRAFVPMAVKLRLGRSRVALRRARRGYARRRGRPGHSPLASAPPLRPGRRRMRLTHVLLASDLNPRYVEFWPLVSRAWTEVVGVEPVLVLVAREEEAPAELLEDPRVRRFEPVEGVHTAFQAQCIRLLYPALLDADGAVLISDMELMPMNRGYWHEPLAALDASFFVAYRDVLSSQSMVAIAYNAAEPRTWSEVFGIRSEDDVRQRLSQWAEPREYDGVRGGSGWFTDQVVLHDTLAEWSARSGRLWLLEDDFTGFRRLERFDVDAALTPKQLRDIRAGRYSDFNAPLPASAHESLNHEAVETAIEGVRRRRH